MNARYELSTEYLDDVGVAQVYVVFGCMKMFINGNWGILRIPAGKIGEP